MNLRLARQILLTFLLVFAMLGPKVSAVGYALSSSQLRTIIICTGDGLREITLNENGDPVSESDVISDLCVQISLEAGSGDPANLLVAFRPPATPISIVAGQIRPSRPFAIRLTPARAPPVV